MDAWDPVAMPYRVLWTHIDPRAPHGWYTHVRTFATEALAIEAAKKPFHAGVTDATVYLALNGATWAKNGKWSQIGRRQRKGRFVRASR